MLGICAQYRPSHIVNDRSDGLEANQNNNIRG